MRLHYRWRRLGLPAVALWLSITRGSNTLFERRETMKRSVCLLLTVAAVLLGAVSAAAQTQPQLPKVLWIFREDTKPARGSAHEKVEHGFAQHWAKSNVQPFLAVEAVSGTATEVMFLSGYDSLAAMENDYQTFGKASNGP